MDTNKMIIAKAIKKYNLSELDNYKTYDQWQAEGRYVKKGEKAAFKCKLWDGLNSKRECYFFSESQTAFKDYVIEEMKKESEREEIEEINKANIELKRDIRRFTRCKAINPGNVENDITDFNDFRKQNFGYIMFSENSKYHIEDLYLDLTIQFPDVFESDIANESDMLINICDKINNIKPLEYVEKSKCDDYMIDGELCFY